MSQETPTNESCKKGAEFSLSNAKKHFKSAEILAENKLFGPAQSHLVLGGEAAIKSIMLSLRGVGLGVKQGTLKEILSQHTPRHNWAIVFLLMNELLGDEGKQELTNLIENAPQDHFGKIPVVDKFIISLGKESVKVIEQDNYKESFNPIMYWWATAELKKQKGFYIDYDDKKWSTPDEVSVDDYNFSHTQASKVIDIAEKLIEAFTALSNDDIKEFKLMLKPLMNRWKQIETDESN